MAAYEELRKFEIFKSGSDEFVRDLAQFANRVEIPKGTVILREGVFNDRLRILAQGEVEVRVNNERVATLDHQGDLMGEISALAGRPVTASLSAITDVIIYEILAVKIEAKIRGSESSFGYRLYSVLAQHLSDKIINTNEKARQFEIANRALVDINKNLDQKVQERTDATFKRLNELQNTLAPLQSLLGTLIGGTQAVTDAAAQVSNAVELLKPISEMYSTERLVRSRRVLIVEPDRKQQTLARMALGGTGAKLEVATTAEESLAQLGAQPMDLIFVSSALADAVPAMVAAAPLAKLVFMVGSELSEEIGKLKTLAPMLSNLVSRHSADRNFTVRNIGTTVTKVISKDIFGLEKYMMWGVETLTRPITCSGDRTALIEEMVQQFASLGVRSTITDRAASVAEELLMNAIYDAPTDNGVHQYQHLPRTTEVNLKPSERGQFRFAVDGMLAAVSVSDPFGGFKMETLIKYLERNANSDGGDVQEKGKGGAGRGLHQIISNSDLVVFNVRAGKQTEVVAFFNLDPSAKDAAPRSFHFFSET